jgi:hypothetical protein
VAGKPGGRFGVGQAGRVIDPEPPGGGIGRIGVPG